MGFNGTWISDNEIMMDNSFLGDITKYNVVTGEKTTIFDGKNLPVRMRVSRNLSRNVHSFNPRDFD